MKRPRVHSLKYLCLASFAGVGLSNAVTVAYYSFEGGTPGNSIATATDTAGSTDLTGFGAVSYSANVPGSTVPLTGASNNVSASFGGGDLFDLSAATSTLASQVFTDFTIESYVNFNSLANFQTIIGRDDSGNPGQGGGPQSLFYLSQDPQGELRAEVITASGANLQINDAFQTVINTWYHVALVGDATAQTLRLYVDGTQVGTTATGFDGLFNPDPNTSWTIGRGQFNGSPADGLNGLVDEVRFSDTALAPSQFLNVPEPSVMLLGGLGVLGLLRRRR